ncbi:MAG: arginine--tRNA ligase [Candidatus Pacebacteria bacterium RIFOXYB1_FULL_39_46]|nr:MAG: arginine--tRNA ligase [Candidatus Pacebacteria bacterium RIFOXYA1_FULL_38_18]OGJ37889.1 MAG: arginine--tRNA ligase [Candidatus Pacebacteria bacterium RIFOXYB1_FULL_39_46]OGJ39488.1 MAG: arginine--tRNA ligase [Candidatus Pacebacteria bacterium RIFOXYC1_FULL_39_21]OGJ40068.1 MAG: arginine--tRNA ligase [Candidatus Pacebacteria bacterium RIFOXYD1_FULL_39_27]
MIINSITQAIQQALGELNLQPSALKLEHPADDQFGDWSSNVALQYIKQTDKFSSPKELAAALVEKLQVILTKETDIQEMSVAGPGFINFTLSSQYWLRQLNEINQVSSIQTIIPPAGQGKRVIVEYSSPNIAKPFTVGHLRSTIIGDALANLYEVLGWEVLRDNHLGDWGTQFGKLIYAIKTWGDREAISKSSRPIKELVELYVKFHQRAEEDSTLNDYGRAWFKKLEEGDDDARSIWQWCVDLSWQEFDKIYTKLKITFTENNGRGYGESFFERRMEQVLEILREKLPQDESEKNGGHYGEGEDGAKLVFFEDKALPSLMILKKDGTTLYSTRDLATDYFRLKEFKPDLVINEVGAEQSLYFKQLYKIEQMLGWYKPKQRVHVKHGLYRFKTRKMSTRKGDVIWLQDVIDEAEQRAASLSSDNQASVEQIAIGALKWNDLKSEAARDISFDWDEILSMKGNSGPYVQYAAVRAQSVLNKREHQQLSIPANYDFDQTELALIKYLNRLAEVVTKAAEEFTPHHLASFLFELAQRFNTFYNQNPILTARTQDQQQVRLSLTQATRLVLSEGLALLGIQTPEEM